MEIAIGVDLGVSGAIAIRNGHLERSDQNAWVVLDIPTYEVNVTPKKGQKTAKRTKYDIVKIIEILRPYAGARAIMEDVHAMPPKGKFNVSSGVVANFSLGHGLGIFETAFTACGIAYYKVAPATWKNKMLAGLKDKTDKDAVRARAQQQYPELAAYFKFQKDHNRAEAVFQCDFGRMFYFPDVDGFTKTQEIAQEELPKDLDDDWNWDPDPPRDGKLF